MVEEEEVDVLKGEGNESLFLTGKASLSHRETRVGGSLRVRFKCRRERFLLLADSDEDDDDMKVEAGSELRRLTPWCTEMCDFALSTTMLTHSSLRRHCK